MPFKLRRCFIFAILVIGGRCFAASPSLPPLTGRIFGDVYVPTQDPFPQKPFQQISSSFWLEADPSFSEHTFARVIGTFDAFDGQYSYFGNLSSASHVELGLREFYLTSSEGDLEIRVGKQIIPWGKSDVFNPTDFNTAKNLGFFNPDDEVRRIGGVSVEILYASGTSPWSSATVLTPFFAQGRLLFPVSLIPQNVVVSDPSWTPVNFQNSEFGEKISYSGSGWDASVSFFNGWSHQPQLLEISHAVVGPSVFVNLQQSFRRVTAFGSDASYGLEKWVFRAESSYTVTPNDSGSNPLELPTHWDSVLGAERPLGNFFRVQVQILLRFFPRYLSPSSASGPDPVSTAVDQLVVAENALLNSYQDPSRPGGTLRLSYTDEKVGLEGEVFFLQNFSGGDFLARPSLSYLASDALKLMLGMELYGGPSNRPLGALAPYSSLFFETKYTF